MFSKKILRAAHKHHVLHDKKDMMSAWVGLNMRLRAQDFQYTNIGMKLSEFAPFTNGF